MEEKNNPESFESFTKSFFYGTRSDLSFKFLSDLAVDDASIFIRDLFKDIIDSLDGGDLEG